MRRRGADGDRPVWVPGSQLKSLPVTVIFGRNASVSISCARCGWGGVDRWGGWVSGCLCGLLFRKTHMHAQIPYYRPLHYSVRPRRCSALEFAHARAHTHTTHTHTHTHQHQTEASSIEVKRQLFPVGHVPVDDCLARYVTPVSIRPLDTAGGRHRFWRADGVREGESAPAHEQGREREPGTLAMAELKTSSNRLPAPISCAVTSAHGLRSSCAGAGVWK